MQPFQNVIDAMERRDNAKVVAAERRVRDLTNTVDDLTTMAQSGIAMQAVKACRAELIEAQRKLNDLLMDSQ